MSADFKPVFLNAIPPGIAICVTAATAAEIRAEAAAFAAAALVVAELIGAMPPAASQEDLLRLAAAEHGHRHLCLAARALAAAAAAVDTPTGGPHAKH